MRTKIIDSALVQNSTQSKPLNAYLFANRAMPIVLGLTALGLGNQALFNPDMGLMNGFPDANKWLISPLANAGTGASIFLMANKIKVWTEGTINYGIVRKKELIHEAKKGVIFGLGAAYLPGLFFLASEAMLPIGSSVLLVKFAGASIFVGSLNLFLVAYNALDAYQIKKDNIDGKGALSFGEIFKSKLSKTFIYYTSFPSAIYGDSWEKRWAGGLIIGAVPRMLAIYTFSPSYLFATFGSAASMVFAWFHSSNRFK